MMRTIFIFSILLGLNGAKAQSWFTSGQNADLMVSGVDFNNTGGALMFNHPNGLASDGTNLLMCDRFNNRVLIWNTAPSDWNTPPDLVLGQTNFIANNPGTGKEHLNWPGNVSIAANGKIAITDTENDRILIWNSFPSSNGQAADISIHLPSICPTNVPQKWEWPWGVWTDGTKLAAVATQGSTLLFWNAIPTTDNQAPDYTITHVNFGTPRNISSDGSSYFFVGDHNAKVAGVPGTFFWNSYPTAPNQPYDFYRNEWIKGLKLSNGKLVAGGIRQIYVWDHVPNSATQNPVDSLSPSCYDNGDGVDVVEANGKIYVCNYNGNDILVYNSTPTGTQPDPDWAIGVSNFSHNTLDSIGYIQNPSLSSDGTRLIVTSDYNKKIYVYNNLPTASGQFANSIISTQSYNLTAWDNALYNNTFVAAGKNNVCVWNNANNLGTNPSRIFNNAIGSAVFSDLKGVALDGSFFYLADKSGKIYIWNEVPANSAVNPAHILNFGNVALNRLSSDGTYFCVTQQSPPSVFIYKVADLEQGNTNPWKTINEAGLLNLPSEAMAFNGSLAIANQGFHDVLLWEDINDAPSTSGMVVLGQATNSPNNNAQIGQNKLFQPGALLYTNQSLWVGEFKFSSRILKYSYALSGTNETNASHSFSIYPNPSDGFINIEFNEDMADPISLKVFDAMGRLIISDRFTSNNHTKTIDLNSIPNGMYLIHVESKGNFTVNKISLY